MELFFEVEWAKLCWYEGFSKGLFSVLCFSDVIIAKYVYEYVIPNYIGLGI